MGTDTAHEGGGSHLMANGEWRKDDLIRFLHAALGDNSAFLKLNLD